MEQQGLDRASELVRALSENLQKFVWDHGVTDGELVATLAFLRGIDSDEELIRCARVMGLTTTIDTVTYLRLTKGATPSNPEGPFYRPNPPVLESPANLLFSTRPGERMRFVGAVRDAKDGSPLSGALVDVWHADSFGVYDCQDEDGLMDESAPFDLRGRLHTDAEGHFEFRSVVPGAYEIPIERPVRQLVKLLGKSTYRPAHVHFRFEAPGYNTLTTQIYIAGDPWIDADVLGSVKPDLIANPKNSSAEGKEGVEFEFEFKLHSSNAQTDEWTEET